MATQEIIVAAVVLLCVAFLFIRAIRSLRAPDNNCSVGCGCGVTRNRKTPDSDRLGRRIDLVQLGTDGAKEIRPSPPLAKERELRSDAR